MTEKEASFFVGPLPVYGDSILAPMDGYSDLPFRSICRRFGSAMSYTPYLNAIELVQGLKRTWQDLRFLPEERPIVFQILDNDEARLLDAGLKIRELEPNIIDVNLGCSVRRVSSRGAGAGLLRNPKKIGRIIHNLSSTLDIPVSAKIRLGWDQETRNYLEVARSIEENGGSLIAVHARTREQDFRGKADWDAIAEIKQHVSIPIIGNGGVKSPDDVQRLINHTGCDAVMIGRAAMGNPWIFQRRSREDVAPNTLGAVILLHLQGMAQFYGERKGLLRFRKHLVHYLEDAPLSKDLRLRLLTCHSVPLLIDLLSECGFHTSASGGQSLTNLHLDLPLDG